jgi:hypothetical protein
LRRKKREGGKRGRQLECGQFSRNWLQLLAFFLLVPFLVLCGVEEEEEEEEGTMEW